MSKANDLKNTSSALIICVILLFLYVIGYFATKRFYSFNIKPSSSVTVVVIGVRPNEVMSGRSPESLIHPRQRSAILYTFFYPLIVIDQRITGQQIVKGSTVGMPK